MSPTVKSTEFIALIAGLITAVVPVVMDKLPANSVWVAILGALLAAATYIAGRSWVKAAGAQADGIVRATEAATKAASPSNPT